MYQVVMPTAGKPPSPISLREKVEMLARCRLRSENPAEVVPPFCAKHGLEVPKHPAQPLSGFAAGFQNLLAKSDQEALKLAKEFGFQLVEVE
jgi:hypothetical protein